MNPQVVPIARIFHALSGLSRCPPRLRYTQYEATLATRLRMPPLFFELPMTLLPLPGILTTVHLEEDAMLPSCRLKTQDSIRRPRHVVCSPIWRS